MSLTVNKLDVVFFQRKDDNSVYEQINISGSSVFFYLDDKGYLTAGKIPDVLRSQANTRQSLMGMNRDPMIGETLYSINTVTVGSPHRLTKYLPIPHGTMGFKIVETETHTIDTPHGIAIGKTDEEPYVNATLDVSGTVIISGSLTVTNFIYGSASYALTASYVSGSTALSDSASYSLTSSWATNAEIPFNGNRGIKRSPYTGLNIGGDDLKEFVEKFFFPFVPATVTINSTTLNYETGSVNNISINGTVTANDETIFDSGSVVRVSPYTNIYNFSVPSYSYSTTHTNVSASCTYKTFVRVGNDGSPTNISSSNKQVNFNFPYLYGTASVAGLTDTALYNVMLKDTRFSSLVTGTNVSYDMRGTSTHIYFAYPATLGPLYSIKDPNLFDITTAFSSYDTSITSSGLPTNWQRIYKVYYMTLPANPNGIFLFNFT